MQVIHRNARHRQGVSPRQVILLGSYAYGTPHEDSDVDLRVVMLARNKHAQAVQIPWRLGAPFAVDLIVRIPKQVTWRLQKGDSFLTAIMGKGKILHGVSTVYST